MKDLMWSSTLSVEVDEIDDDHRKLVDLFNLLNHAVQDEDDPAYVDAVLEELICCTVWHFSHEERLMVKYGYDAYEPHKAAHEELIASARELQARYRTNGEQLSPEDIEYLEHWLVGHVLGADMPLGAFLAQAM